ncbi:MAG: hypothetical protein ACM359_00370 [Bacillota bacterium]
MSELIRKIVMDREAASLSTWRRYAELLLDGVDTPEEIEEMRRLMPLLSKRPEDLEPDRQILLKVQSLRRSIRDGRAATEAIDSASQAREAYVAESRRLFAEREKGLQEHHRLVAQHQERDAKARQAIATLNELRQKHAQLLNHEPEATEKDLT